MILIFCYCIRFIQDNDYQTGWYMKAPYTANNLHYKGRSCNSFEAIIQEVNSAISKDLRQIFPYLLLQILIPKPKEYKVIMHDGKCKYFNNLGKMHCYSPKFGTPAANEVLGFAASVYNALALRSDSVILSGLVRIDIMRLITPAISRLFVNEVEGVDSNYSASANADFELSTQRFLKRHWGKVINEVLQEFI